jgi:hypothetical protein
LRVGPSRLLPEEYHWWYINIIHILYMLPTFFMFRMELRPLARIHPHTWIREEIETNNRVSIWRKGSQRPRVEGIA